MAIKSVRWKQQGFRHLMLKDHSQTKCLLQPLSHCGAATTRTRTMSRKCVGGYSSSVILLKMCLFVLVFVLSNFHASFGRKHNPSDHNYHHHHHPDHHLHHSSGGGFRSCSHRPPKPEEVRHNWIHRCSISLYKDDNSVELIYYVFPSIDTYENKRGKVKSLST